MVKEKLSKTRDNNCIITEYNGVPLHDKMFLKYNEVLKPSSCHGSFFNKECAIIKQYIDLSHTPYTLNEIEKWVEFMNDCGFKCKLVEEKDNYKDSYNGDASFDCYIEYNRKNYISQSHWKIGITAIRMIVYSRTVNLYDIPSKAMELYKTKGYEDAYYTLISLFKGREINNYTGNHNLIDQTKIKKFTPITRKELEENCIKYPNEGVNNLSVK